MIAVIADDLTGAAEIGGIALRHGLRVVMDTKVTIRPDTDVLVIATDTRSQTAGQAKQIIAEVMSRLRALHPEIIFKKTDSLLRGHVGEELLTQMDCEGKKRALLIPANPSLKRTIQNGVYYADNIPLNQSDLADASRHKINTSDVLHLIGEKHRELTRVISLQEPLPEKGLIIGNTLTEADLDRWALALDGDTIPAGGSGFFNAVLKTKARTQKSMGQEQLVVGNRIIYVCGSAFPLSKASVAEARSDGRYVSYMPEETFCPQTEQEDVLERWVADIINGLKQDGQVIIAVNDLQCSSDRDLPGQVREVMAVVIEKVMHRMVVNELVIEGGATASSIIEKLQYQRFFPSQELALGVIRMKVQEAHDLFLTMKPGSYQWPPSIWKIA